MRQHLLWLLMACVCLGGCGQGKPPGKSVTVNGRILVNGKPMADLTVGFYALNKGVSAKYRYMSGVTDDEGDYNIGGVYPGEYMVLLIDPPAKTSFDDPNKILAVPGSPMLEKYATNSPLRADVSPDSKTHDFKIVASKRTTASATP